MMNFNIEGLRSLQSKGAGSLLMRVVGSLVVGLCVVAGLVGRGIEHVCRKCSEIIASVRDEFYALARGFANAVVCKGDVGRSEFGAMSPVIVATREFSRGTILQGSPPRSP